MFEFIVYQEYRAPNSYRVLATSLDDAINEGVMRRGGFDRQPLFDGDTFTHKQNMYEVRKGEPVLVVLAGVPVPA